MEIKSLTNLETAFQTSRRFALAIVLGSVLLAALAFYFAWDFAMANSQRVYILNHGAAVEALASSVRENRAAEARFHVRYYHDLMFTISPDPRSIDANAQRAFYLGDLSVKRPYEINKEENFYSDLIGNNMTQTYQSDSIRVTMQSYPYRAVAYGKVTIRRRSSTLVKSLVTACDLIDVNRSENSPNGLLMQRYTILENSILSAANR